MYKDERNWALELKPALLQSIRELEKQNYIYSQLPLQRLLCRRCSNNPVLVTPGFSK